MNQQQITIRKPKLDEWERYKNLRLKAIRECPIAFTDTLKEAESKDNFFWKNRIRESEKEESSFMLMAYDSYKMIGMIALFWDNKEKTRHVANLVSFYVDSQNRGRGIGGKLLNEIFKKAKSKKFIRKIRLGVFSKNPAKLFYEKHGFEVVGKFREAIFYDGKYYDEDVMEMDIASS